MEAMSIGCLAQIFDVLIQPRFELSISVSRYRLSLDPNAPKEYIYPVYLRVKDVVLN